MDYLTAKGIVESGKGYEPLALKAIAHLVDRKELSSYFKSLD